MTTTMYALLYDCNDDLLDELRGRGVGVSHIVLGDWGYVTEENTEYVCDAINDLMSADSGVDSRESGKDGQVELNDDSNWQPLVWDDLDRHMQVSFMEMVADSDTFMEKSRLPSNYGYEDRIRGILGIDGEKGDRNE